MHKQKAMFTVSIALTRSFTREWHGSNDGLESLCMLRSDCRGGGGGRGVSWLFLVLDDVYNRV